MVVSKVNIPASLYEALLFHALSDESNEVMGLLIGELNTADNDASDDSGKFVYTDNAICVMYLYSLTPPPLSPLSCLFK